MTFFNLRKVLTPSLLILAICCFNSCSDTAEKCSTSAIEETIDSLKRIYAPDKRIARFEIKVESAGCDTFILSGTSDQKKAVQSLLDEIQHFKYPFKNDIEIWPPTHLDDSIYALVNNSVANLRSDHRHSSELATQALLGMPLKILKLNEDKEWFLVQTPDQYISWVDHGAIHHCTKETILAWQQKEKVMFNRPYGFAFEDRKKLNVVSDLVYGDLLIIKDSIQELYEVIYPDGRTGFVNKSETIKFKQFVEQDKHISSALKLTHLFKGTPYLWGGTSAKGMDCSGLTKLTYMSMGYIIPRDASQQVKEGALVDSTGNFQQLQHGDLLFFGRHATDTTQEKITHVGIWTFNGLMIHSSGKVRLSSFNSDNPFYDAFNQSRYIKTKRYIGRDSKNIINLRDKDFYEIILE